MNVNIRIATMTKAKHVMQTYNETTTRISNIVETMIDKTRVELIDVSFDTQHNRVLIVVNVDDVEHMFEYVE